MLKLVLLFCLSISLFGSIGKVTGSIGDVYIIRDMKSMKIKTGEEVQAKDLFVSRSKSKVQITFIDETIISIGQKSSLLIEEYVFDEKNAKKSRCSLKVAKGSFRTITGKIGKIAKENFKLKTQKANISVKGTEYAGDQIKVMVISGSISVERQGQIQNVNPNQYISLQGPVTGPQQVTPEMLEQFEQDTGLSTTPTQTQNNGSSNTQGGNTQNKKQGQQKQPQGSTQGDETNQMPLIPPENEPNNPLLPPQPIPDNKPPVVPDDQEPKLPPSITSNSNPTLNVADATLDEDTSKVISFSGSDTDGDSLTYTISSPSNGTATLNGTQITYTPTSDYFGTDSITLTADDGKGGKVTKTINFTINNIAEESLFTNIQIANNELQYYSESTWTNMKLSNGANGATTFSGNLPSSGFGIIGEWNSDYNIFADSLGEFASILHKTTDTDIDKVMQYAGDNLDITKLDGDSIFTYDLKYMTLFYGPEYGIAIQNTGNTDRIAYYFNNETKSITRYDDSSLGASSLDYFPLFAEYFAGKVDPSDGSITIKRVGSNFNFADIPLSNIVGNLYGSNLQGFGISGDEGANQFKQIATLNSSTAIAQNGSPTLSGFATSENYILGISPTIGLDTISLTLNRDTGATSGTLSESATGTDDTITWNGTVNDLSSYYIDDDQFGVLSSAASLGGNGKANGDSGFLVALPDDITITASDYVSAFDVDNESSWGYWEQLDDLGNMERGFWVAGIATNPVDIQALIDGSTKTFNFSGHVLGTLPGGATIPVDSNNIFTMNLSLGGGTNSFTANMQFNDGFGDWNINFIGASGTAINSKFESFNATGTSSNGNINNASPNNIISGKYYGTGSIKSVGGKWTVENTSNEIASGVFKGNVQ